jgi:hypothetical protein
LEADAAPDSTAATAIVEFRGRMAALLCMITSDDRATIPVKITEYFIVEL